MKGRLALSSCPLTPLTIIFLQDIPYQLITTTSCSELSTAASHHPLTQPQASQK
jgi:hypothetical protein